MNTCRISIIVPVYNVEKYISHCLDSLVMQTLNDIEIILIDDGSSDSSGIICDEYAQKDLRIKVIHQENMGVSESRNVALAVAKGEFVLFVDSDDWIEADMCEKLYTTAKEHSADFVFCAYFDELSDGTKIKAVFDEEKKVFNKEEIMERLLKGVVGLTGTALKNPERIDRLVPTFAKLYNRSVIENNSICFKSLKTVPSECQLFNFQFFMYTEKALYIKMPYYHYRRNNLTSITQVYRSDLIQKWLNWMDIMNKMLEENNIKEKLSEAYYSRICFSVIPLGGNAILCDKLNNRLNEIKCFLKNPKYITAFKKLDFQYFPIHWKVFFGLAKARSVLGFYIITKIMRFIMNRGRK